MITTPYHGRLQTAMTVLTKFESHFDPLGQHLRFYSWNSLTAALENAHFTAIDIATDGMPLLRRSLIARARY